MFCVKCGNELTEHDIFCPKCGTAVHSVKDNTEATKQTQSNQQSNIVASSGQKESSGYYDADVVSTMWMMRGYKGRWARRLQIHIEGDHVILQENKKLIVDLKRNMVSSIERSMYAAPLALVSGVLCSAVIALTGGSNGRSIEMALVLFVIIGIFALVGFVLAL